MARFGKEKDSSRKEELDRQAAEEVARLTRSAGPPSGRGGMGAPGGGPIGIPSPLEQIAEEIRDAPRPSMRQVQAPRRKAPPPAQAFTPMPSGSVGSSFGPGGLNPGPRTGISAPPPPAFGGGVYEEDYGGHVTGPPVYDSGEPDEDEEMSITEMALMDHAARTGHSPEELVMMYDATSAEEMRDEAMRKFYERQQARRPGAAANNPFAPAGMRGGPSGPARARRNEDPAAAGGALAQRLANRRRREEEEARRARGEPEPGTPSPDESAADDGALARVLARRRQSLGMNEPAPAGDVEVGPESSPAPGRRHAQQRAETSPGLRAVAAEPVLDEETPDVDDTGAAPPTRRSARTAKSAAVAAVPVKAPAKKTRKPASSPAAPLKAVKAPAKGRSGKKAATLAPPAPGKASATKGSATKVSATKVPATKVSATKVSATKVPSAKKAPAAAKKAPARKAGAKAVFCIECGEKNPAIAKFCFSCGTRLAAPEG